VPSELASEFESMLAAQIRNLVNEVVHFVRTHNLGKVVKGAQLCETTTELDIGDPLQDWSGNAGRDFVWESDVVRDNLESVVSKAAAKLVGPGRAWCPGPVCGGGLGTGVNIRPELRKQFVGIHP